MSTVRLRRAARVPRPVVPEDDVVLQPPPELPRGGSSNIWFTALPALSGLGSVAYLLAGPPNPITYIAGGFFFISALGMVVGSLMAARSQNRGEVAEQRGDFLRHLARTRERVRRTAQAQRLHEEWGGPPPDTLWTVVASPRLWERRTGDDDFGAVRIGVGPRQLASPLVPSPSGPVEDLDPLSATALRRFVTTHRVVPELPLKVLLRRFAAIGFGADPDRPDAARALVRAVLGQAAVFHAPTDLIIMVATARPDDPAWSWVKWLPHAQHPTEVDFAGPVRLLDPSLQALEDLLGAELTRRSGFNPTAEPATDLPHVLLVLDGARVTGTELALDPEGLAAVTVLDLDGQAGDVVRQGGVRLEIDADGRLSVLTGAQRQPLGRADELAVPAAEALARQLAGYRLAAGADAAEDLSSVDAALPVLLGSPDAAALDLDELWRPRPQRDRLRAPIGIGADGSVLELDIKESAQDGMGPHGLLIGATGSGKSELLRTLVLGLAALHPPDVLNLVLVDFKGGATFAGMSRLGHVAAVITNLQDDVGLVARMHEALTGELNRRQELLRAAGGLVSVRDYERARQRGAALEPLPSLVVVVDEFTELISQQESFVELFVQIGRLGRSLGLHLLLASQRLDEGRIRGLEAHLSYRIALRTFSAEESRTVLGVTDAYTLPNAPGHGLLKADTALLTRFRSTYVSGNYIPGDDGAGGRLAGPVDVRPFPARLLPVPPAVAAAAAAARAAAAPEEDDPTQPTVLSVMVEQIAARGGRAHQVWLPPLNEPAPLDALLGGLALRPGRGFGASPDTAPLQVAVGHVDLPFEQRREPLLIDLAGAGGHVGVVGRPRSGKSTLLRTLLGALALRHTPAEVQFYCLDFSGALQAMAGLPHIGGMAGRQDPDVVRRLIAEVATVLEDRERRFRELGIDSMVDYRRRRASGEVADDPYGDVFLVVDGWGVLRSEFDEQEERILALAARSLSYGVHLVLSANRWMDMRMGLRDIIGTKTELRIGDPIDSEIDRKLAGAVPDRPGRGIGPRKAHHLVGVPRVDGRASADGLAEGLAELVARVAEAWSGPAAPAVRLLPRLVELDELRPAAATANGRRELVLGLEGDRLGTVRLDQRGDPGLLLIGDQETGKTATLRAIARQVVETNPPNEAMVLLVDYRRGMLGEFDGRSQLAYVRSAAEIGQVVAELVSGFEQRLPGPEVTAEQMRSRSWWRGPDIHLIVDDYELVATASNPFLPLLPFLAQARDVGLHLYVARRAGGASRALLDPVLGGMRELNFPAVLLSAPRDEVQLLGLRTGPQPVGRGVLVHRRLGTVPVQLARQDARVTG